MSTVVDASVAVMWFVTEQHSQNALRLLAAEYDLHAPDLIQAEVASAMLKAVRRKWIGLDKARRSIEEMCAAPVRLYRATEHVEGASGLSLEAYLAQVLRERSYAVSRPTLTRSQIAGERIRELRKGVTLGGSTIKELIEEGRE